METIAAPRDAAAPLATDSLAAGLDITVRRGQITLPTPEQRASVWMALTAPTGLPPFTRLVAHTRDITRRR